MTLKLRDYQREGSNFLLARKKALLADDMGLGKTAQTINALVHGKLNPALVVCPATLKFVWADEVEKWHPEWKVQVIKNGADPIDRTADVVVVNYDLLVKKRPELLSLDYKAIVLDEAHYIKNPKAQRTRVAIELAWRIPYRFLLTGTPVINKPIELVPLLKCMGRLNEFGGWHNFTKRYAPPRNVRRGGRTIKVYDGAANLHELRGRLERSCMIRRTKQEVLKELPRTQRVTIPVEIDNKQEYRRCENDLKSWLMEQAIMAEDEEDMEKWRNSVSVLGMNATAETLTKITYLKQVAARGKVKQVITWVRDFLEDTDRKLVVFAHHRDIIDELHKAFPDAAVIRGGDSQEQREKAVKDFQNHGACRLFIGSVKAAGVGLTLTAASDVLFAELTWSPADLQQAIDRVNRMGQESDRVFAYFMVAKDTIEKHVVKRLNEKAKVIRAIMGDGPTG